MTNIRKEIHTNVAAIPGSGFSLPASGRYFQHFQFPGITKDEVAVMNGCASTSHRSFPSYMWSEQLPVSSWKSHTTHLDPHLLQLPPEELAFNEPVPESWWSRACSVPGDSRELHHGFGEHKVWRSVHAFAQLLSPAQYRMNEMITSSSQVYQLVWLLAHLS